MLNEDKTLFDEVANNKRLLENEIYGVLCKFLPQYESRGFNFHARAQSIAGRVGDEFTIWVNQNDMNQPRTKY